MTAESLNGAVRNSSINRRQALRTGLLAGIGVAGVGSGLLNTAPAASAGVEIKDLIPQTNWRWCRKCQGHFFGGSGTFGFCPFGNAHDSTGSGDYYLWYSEDPPRSDMQPGWRWCRRCQSLSYAAVVTGLCPGFGRHDLGGSGNYHVFHDVGVLNPNEQDQWNWCRKCQGLFYGPNQSRSWCAGGNRHDGTGSGNYMVQYLSSPKSGVEGRQPGRGSSLILG
ncbi:hypothetical protein [Actinocrispum wychmicini]|uniref:Uncharacterized protein n=1 Tax=Actinocrispum wychmicini TaxID=1213861 RepID=A0A4R2JKV8_9PSEU|nr:hypothetical protein [Actinocrispum wychmicini]TCO60641.1 hypothetical protein EV192_103216 [Actinocrispum wychmicini]